MSGHAPFDWSGKKPTTSLAPAVQAPARAIESLTHQLDQTQWLSTNDIEASQFAQLRTMARHFEDKLPAFRARLQTAGLGARDLASFDALRRLPLLSRRALQDLSGVPDRGLHASHLPIETLHTSGSTGEPVVVRRTAVNALFWHALTMRELFWHRTSFASRFTAIRATNTLHALLPNWGEPVSLFFETGPAQVFPITADIRQQLKWLVEFQPNILLVYPSVLDAIAQLCVREDIALPGLGLIRTVGETLPPHIRQAAAATFRCKVIDNYSSQETGVIALQCPDSDLYHVMDETLIVEVIDDQGNACKPGEVGRAVITDLRNAAVPLFRYDTGDLVEAGAACPCGRGLHTLKRIIGRERNLIVMPDGTRHWPLVGFARFRDVAPVQQYRLVQTHRDAIEVQLVAEREITAAEETSLRQIIQRALGYPFALRFVYFDGTVPRGANGKFEEFVCRIQS